MNYIEEFKKITSGTKYQDSEALYFVFRNFGKEGKRFLDIVIENKLNISQSPYSHSLYAFRGNEEISWTYKPEGSFRISDHWNFNGHCITEDGVHFAIMICQYHNGIYIRI